jgi:hypothetical protein
MRDGKFVGVTLCALVATLAAPRAHAGGSREVEKAAEVLRINREAMELFESLEFELARKQLLEAISIGQKAGLTQHTVMAKTHGNLALVYAAMKDEPKAVEEFRQALSISSEYRPPKERSTPEIAAMFERAQKASGGSSTDGPVDPTAASGSAEGPKVTSALRCPTSGEVPPGEEVTLRCVTSTSFKPSSIVLFYKRPGQEDFVAVPMRAPSDGGKPTWSGKIPARDVNGAWLPFYFEARGDDGTALALAGRSDSPNILTVAGGSEAAADVRKRARPSRQDNEDKDDENPLERRRRLAEGDDGTGMQRGFFLGLGLGSGVGYAGSSGLEAYKSDQVRGYSPGVAGALYGHVTPELGYHVTKTIALTLQGRNQYIPHDGNVTASGANAVLARALFFDSAGASRFYGALSLGGGEGFRLVVNPTKLDGTAATDTVRGGPVVAGVGGGFSYDLGETFAWMIETNLLTGFPSFSAVLDVNMGLRAFF